MVTEHCSIVQETVPLERRGVSLHLACYRLDATTPQESILLIHGLTYSSHDFDVDYEDYSLVRFLARHGYAVWLLDIAGYGQSERLIDGFRPDSDYAVEDIAAAVRLILARQDRSQLHILGWSWGTVTSGRFAAKYPKFVKKLVLYAPIVAGLGCEAVENPFNENTWQHAAGDFQLTGKGEIDYNIVERQVAATFLADCWRYDQSSSPNGGRRDLMVDREHRLIPTAAIKAPVLIIAGTLDPYVSPALCEEAYATLVHSDSQLLLIPGAAHAMMMEKPYYKTFREKVLAFLAD